MAKDIYIISAKRTVFGAFGGSLKGLSATDLGVIASESALKEAGVAREDFGHVMFGNVMQTSVDAIYLGRHVGLRAELPENVPALTINRLCGSGFQAVISGAEQILLGDTDVTLVGGT